MGQGLTNQIVNSVPGMHVVGISNRRPERAVDAFRYAGVEPTSRSTRRRGSTTSSPRGGAAVTDDPFLLCRSEHVDVICEVTGAVELGAQVALEAFAHGKDVVLMNAELDATIGPILNVYADRHGVILSACDGDEPGVQLNLYRWVKGLGLEPRVIGNVKGLQDPYRNPTTQKGFAETWGQNPSMVTSFADGSKISFEQAIVANATGFTVRQRGMSRGLEYRDDVMTIGRLYDVDELRERRRHRRLRRRHAAHEGLRARRARRPQAAALPQSLQDRRGAARTRSSSRTTSSTSRCRTRSRASPSSAIRSPERSRGRSSRSAPSPSATSRPARRSTTTAST